MLNCSGSVVIADNSLANATGCFIVWNEAQRRFQPQIDCHGHASIPAIFGAGRGIGGALVAKQSGRIAALAGWASNCNAAKSVVFMDVHYDWRYLPRAIRA